MLPLPTLVSAAVSWLEQLDRDLLHLLNCRIDVPALDWLFLRTQSKSVAVPVFVGVLLLSGLVDRRRALRALLTAAAGFGICMGLATLMWAGIGRPRPVKVYPRILQTQEEVAGCAATPGALVVRKHASTRPAFPSRHALTAGVFAAALWGIARWMGLLGSVFALLAAFGRVYAGLHWPSDVLAGLAIGALVAWGVWRLLPPLFGLHGRRDWVQRESGQAAS